MKPEDKSRIEQAAKEAFVDRYYDYQDCFVAGFKAGCDFTQPTIEQKDKDILELVEGLKQILDVQIDGFTRIYIAEQLIQKHQ